MDTPITAAEYSKRLADLCARGGKHMFPRRPRDRTILLHALSRAFPARESALDERAVGTVIRAWLDGTGQALDIDAVSLRRALVDEGFLERRPDGSGYRASQAFQGTAAFAPSVAAIDPDLIVAEARVRGEARRRAFQESQADTRETPGTCADPA